MLGTDKLCGYCAYMDLDTIKKGKFRCERDGEWRFADDDVARECYKFCAIFWSKLDAARDAIEQSRSYRRAAGCYIVTAVAKMLGLPENCEEAEVLKKFRLEVMTNESKYKADIMRYDILGPILADSILKDGDITLAMDLYKIYIQGAVSYIKKGDYDAAVELYFHEMIDCLVNSRIMTSPVIPEGVINLYDSEMGGNNCFETKGKQI